MAKVDCSFLTSSVFGILADRTQSLWQIDEVFLSAITACWVHSNANTNINANTNNAKTDAANKSHTNSGSIVEFQTLALPENCLGANVFVVGSTHDHIPRSMRVAVVCDRHSAGTDDRGDDSQRNPCGYR